MNNTKQVIKKSLFLIFSVELKIEKFDIIEGIVSLPNSFKIFLNIMCNLANLKPLEFDTIEPPMKTVKSKKNIFIFIVLPKFIPELLIEDVTERKISEKSKFLFNNEIMKIIKLITIKIFFVSSRLYCLLIFVMINKKNIFIELNIKQKDSNIFSKFESKFMSLLKNAPPDTIENIKFIFSNSLKSVKFNRKIIIRDKIKYA